jgi:hypothetical protein
MWKGKEEMIRLNVCDDATHTGLRQLDDIKESVDRRACEERDKFTTSKRGRRYRDLFGINPYTIDSLSPTLFLARSLHLLFGP